MTTKEALIDESVAAQALGINRSTLGTWRRCGKGPPYVRLGRTVRYRPSDLAAFVAQRIMHPVRHPHAIRFGGDA
jgi:predicted DNA-binding transcriptional regulator AlpA